MSESVDEFYERIGKPIPKWIQTVRKIKDPMERLEFLARHHKEQWYKAELTSTNEFILEATKRHAERAMTELKKAQEILAWQNHETER